MVADVSAQVHVMVADNASQKDEDSKNVFILAQQTDKCSMSPHYLLLDSESSIHLFINPKYVHNIHPTTMPINID